MRAFVLVLMALGTPTLAQDQMTADEFEYYVEGRTVAFSVPGGPVVGVEMYLADRRVLWSATPGQCTQGEWFAQDGSICFLYETSPQPKCWDIFKDAKGMRAVLSTGSNAIVLTEHKAATPALVCDNLSS